MDAETFSPMPPSGPADVPLAASPSLEPRYLTPDEIPCLDHIVTEDDTPVDNIYSVLQQKLLTEPLYSSWGGPGEGRTFLALDNVGLFYAVAKPALVPDVLLSLDVQPAADIWRKQNRSYFIWVFGKPPEVVLEIVSNREGEEDARKFHHYAQLGILYYVIWDPERHLGPDSLRIFTLSEKRYVPLSGNFLPIIGLGLTQWEGAFQNATQTWLRWSDASGAIIPTGAERAKQEHQRAEEAQQRTEEAQQQAEEAQQRAEEESQRAEQARQRAERLAAQLRSLGVQPENGA
jgi:Uma2 family endonuclease